MLLSSRGIFYSFASAFTVTSYFESDIRKGSGKTINEQGTNSTCPLVIMSEI